jgi:hypothetical protein
MGDSRGELAHRGEAVGYDEAIAEARDLPQIACHQNQADPALSPVVELRRGDRYRHGIADQRAQIGLLLAKPLRGIELDPLQQVHHGAALQSPGIRPEQPLHPRIGDADASVEAQQRDTIRQGRQDVGGEGSRRHQRVAVAVEAPRDRAHQERDGRGPQAGDDATHRGKHTVRQRRDRQR